LASLLEIHTSNTHQLALNTHQQRGAAIVKFGWVTSFGGLAGNALLASFLPRVPNAFMLCIWDMLMLSKLHLSETTHDKMTTLSGLAVLPETRYQYHSFQDRQMLCEAVVSR
jgi:hypothetical protein